MLTIQNMQRRVQRLTDTYIPKKLHCRFLMEVEALSTKQLASLNANGRSLSNNRWSGETRIRRTVTEERSPSLLLHLVLKEFVPERGSYVSRWTTPRSVASRWPCLPFLLAKAGRCPSGV